VKAWQVIHTGWPLYLLCQQQNVIHEEHEGFQIADEIKGKENRKWTESAW